MDRRLSLINKLIEEFTKLKLKVKTKEDKYYWSVYVVKSIFKITYSFNIDSELHIKLQSMPIKYQKYSLKEINCNYKIANNILKEFIKVIEDNEVIDGEEL